MCGKAWMNGLVPYVDFTDSKGPLLWLIYGIGYLMSRHSYVGVFWISILFYAVTLFVAYKLCRLFAGKAASVVSTAVLPLFLLCFIYHYEVLSEDFCHPFMMTELYCLCRILKDRDSDGRTYFRLSVLMGVCSMCCMLIKYNIGAMTMAMMAVVFYMSVRHKTGIRCLAGLILGFVATALPIIICFIVYGNMGAFIHEYFINTFVSIENRMADGWFFMRPETLTLRLLSGFMRLTPLVVLLIGVILFCKIYRLGYWIVFLYIVVIACLGQVIYIHYYVTAMPFFVFPVLMTAEWALRRYPMLRRRTATICLTAAVLSVGVNGCVGLRFQMGAEARTNYYTAAYIMAQVDAPTVCRILMTPGQDCPPALFRHADTGLARQA